MFENEVLINGIAIDWNDIKVVLNAREITPYRSTGKFPGDLNKHSIHLTLSDGEIKYLKMMNIHSNLIDSEEQWEYYYKRGTNCFFRSNGRKFQLDMAANPDVIKLLVKSCKYNLEIK